MGQMPPAVPSPPSCHRSSHRLCKPLPPRLLTFSRERVLHVGTCSCQGRRLHVKTPGELPSARHAAEEIQNNAGCRMSCQLELRSGCLCAKLGLPLRSWDQVTLSCCCCCFRGGHRTARWCHFCLRDKDPPLPPCQDQPSGARALQGSLAGRPRGQTGGGVQSPNGRRTSLRAVLGIGPPLPGLWDG